MKIVHKLAFAIMDYQQNDRTEAELNVIGIATPKVEDSFQSSPPLSAT